MATRVSTLDQLPTLCYNVRNDNPTFGPEFIAQYEQGTLKVSDRAAIALHTDGVDRQAPTDKPSSQPWVDFEIVGPGESTIPNGKHFSYEVMGEQANLVTARVGLEESQGDGPATVNEWLVAWKLGATLAEKLHNKRIGKFATATLASVTTMLVLKAGSPLEAAKEVSTYVLTLGSYVTIRGLGKLLSPRWSLSSTSSYNYAHRVVQNATKAARMQP